MAGGGICRAESDGVREDRQPPTGHLANENTDQRMRSPIPFHPSFRQIIRTVLTLGALGTTSLAGQDTIAQARDVYKDYIEVRKLIGEESASWQAEKIALADMIAVLKAEVAQIEEVMTTLRGSATAADEKRTALHQRLEAAREISTAFNGTITSFEQQLQSLAVRLPEPLHNELQPLLARLPEDPANTRLGYSQRLQTVIGVLAQADKFNTDVKYISEVKTVGGESVEVQTIYLGLGAALFTDASRGYAGYGHPGSDGWNWSVVSGAEAAAIADSIDIYLSRKSPAFVSVPLLVD